MGFDAMSNGDIIAGEVGGKVMKYDNATGYKYIIYLANATVGTLQSILIDSSDNIWVGSMNSYLLKLSSTGTELASYYIENLGEGWNGSYAGSVRTGMNWGPGGTILMSTGDLGASYGVFNIIRFNPNTTVFNRIVQASDYPAGYTSAFAPTAFAADVATGYMYAGVYSPIGTDIVRFSISGGAGSTITSIPSGAGAASWYGAGTDSSGNLHVFDGGNSPSAIWKWSPGGGSTPTLYSTVFPGSSGAYTIRFRDGFIYGGAVTARAPLSNLSDMIQPFNGGIASGAIDLAAKSDGYWLRQGGNLIDMVYDSAAFFSVKEKKVLTGISGTRGMAYDANSNTVYISSSTSILAYDVSSKALTTFASGLTAAGALAVSDNGTLFAIDANSVKMFNGAGTPTTIASGFSIDDGVTSGSKPYALYGLAVDADFNVFISTVGFNKYVC